MALITIAIPVYNEEEFLRETLDSALSQDYRHTRIIVCDNFSTDNSYEIAEEYKRENDHISVIRHSSNIGAAENFKHCLMLADTKYFVWLGAHDIFTEDYMSTAVEYMEDHPEVVLVYPSEAVFIDKKNEIVQRGACSKIELKNNRSRIERIICVVKNLSHCTNIHGVFVTEVAKKLPFEKIVGPDNFQLAIAAYYGEIHAVNIQGIRRREVRQESNEEKERRWVEQRIFPQTWYHPRLLLIWKHLEFILKNGEIGIIDKVKFFTLSPFMFRWWRPLKATFRRLRMSWF